MATVRPISAATVKPRPVQLAISPASAASSPASAASPGSATSYSGISPAVALACKPSADGTQAMAAAAMATVMQPKTSITSKEWVIPPRPKPGRKPATDTPPTKRKAQNRAAQRAFRERRAARVGELEEQLADQTQEYDRTQQELRDHIGSLDNEVQHLRGQCSSLENMLAKERAERSRVEQELDSLKRKWNMSSSRQSSRHESFNTLSGGRTQSILSHHTPSRDSMTSFTSGHRNSAFSISQIISPPDLHHSSSALDHNDHMADPTGCGNCSTTGACACINEALEASSAGCGKCSIGTKCACLEAALNGPIPSSDIDLKRRAPSPFSAAPEEKRQKSDATAGGYPNEIDFTAMFSSKKKAPEPPSLPVYEPNPQPMIPRDRCGFCEDGTYCMCAEAAAAAAAAAAASSSQTLPPMGQQVQTPPPSENDVGPPVLAYEITSTGAVKLPGIRSLNRDAAPKKKPGGCGPGGAGPGTCAQCIADPKSGLFCRSLAALRASESSSTSAPSGGCCGGSSTGGGCCKTKSSSSAGPTSASGLGVSLSCADAYKTLSSHQNFDKAADEIGTWLPKLKAIPIPRDGAAAQAQPARLPIEVETASIMSVLRGFDVRFGREG